MTSMDDLFSRFPVFGLDTDRALDLDEVQALAVKTACDAQDTKGEAAPMWVLVRKKHITLLPTAWADEEKAPIVAALRRLIALDREILRYSFSSEAWIASSTAAMPMPGEEGFVMPSERADRKEILFVHSYDRKGPHRSKVFNMFRSDTGKIIREEDPEFQKYRSIGHMWNLFRPEVPINRESVERGLRNPE